MRRFFILHWQKSINKNVNLPNLQKQKRKGSYTKSNFKNSPKQSGDSCFYAKINSFKYSWHLKYRSYLKIYHKLFNFLIGNLHFVWLCNCDLHKIYVDFILVYNGDLCKIYVDFAVKFILPA